MIFEKLLNKDIQTFIDEHLNADTTKLLLNPPSLIKGIEKEVVEQIISRKKLKHKAPSIVDQYSILPPPLSIEQATGEELAKYKSTLISGNSLVDLTGGLGIDFYFISKQFNHTWYVEKQENIFNTFKFNSASWATDIQYANQSAEEFLNAFKGQATFYIDPARRDSANKKVAFLDDCSPDLQLFWNELMEKSDQVLVKLSPMIDIQDSLNRLPGVTDVFVLGLNNEVKEVLFLGSESKENPPNIRCLNLPEISSEFTFSLEEEKSASVDFSSPHKYLYEPNATILKAGAFKSIANSFNLKKIAPNTHFYTSEEANETFPGRIFEISPIKTKQLKSLNKINVIARNYPLSTAELKKKYKLTDGGNQYLIAFRDSENKPQITIGERAFT